MSALFYGFLAAGLVLLSLVTSISAGAASEEVSRVQEEVERLGGHLKEQKESVRQITRKEATAFDEFEKAGKMLSAARGEERKIKNKLAEVEGEISSLSAQLDDARNKIASRKDLVAARLKAMYKHSRGGYFSSVFASDTHTAALRHYRYLSLIAESDQKLFSGFSKATSDALVKFNALEQQKKELVALQDEAARKSAEVAQRKKEKKDLLTAIRKEKSFYASVVKGLEESSRSLQSLLKDIHRTSDGAPAPATSAPSSVPPAATAPPATLTARRDTTPKGVEKGSSFAAEKGKLPWPVNGEVVGRFGRYLDPQTKEEATRRGVEIAATAGSDVSAVFQGNIIYSSWLKGYGKAVILDHGGTYYTVYAHLADILVKEGDRIEQGGLIGKAGDTGSLRGTDLYFEVRHAGDPEDPILWLKRR